MLYFARVYSILVLMSFSSDIMTDQLQIKFMSLDLEKLVSGQKSYQLNIRDTIQLITQSGDRDGILKKVILFCKYAFSVNGIQRKKYLCLFLIRDILQSLKTESFDSYQKMLQANIAQKLLKTIMMQNTKTFKNSRLQEDDNEQYSDKLVAFATETIVFWSKRSSASKSAFRQVYEELKKMKLPLPKNFKYYNPQLLLQVWTENNVESLDDGYKKLSLSPIMNDITIKFNALKGIIEKKVSETLKNQQQLGIKDIQKDVKQFLLMFFAKLSEIEEDTSLDKGSVVIYFHIINTFYKKINNRQYIPINEMITITKQAFQGNYNSQIQSINRMDIVSLASTQKYNALTIFERIHRRIQQQEKLLPPCQLTLEISQFEKRKIDKSRVSV